MSSLFTLGTVRYTHSVVLLVIEYPRLLEYIQFVMGMHLQGYWGDVSDSDYIASNAGLKECTTVSSAYDLVEEFELLGDTIIIVTHLRLSITIVSMSGEL